MFGLTLLVMIVAFVLYWLPTMWALFREHPRTAQIAVLNFFLGWTLIGWVVALMMAVGPVPAGTSGAS